MRQFGGVVWLTGLPSAGKTTLAHALARRVRAGGVDCEVLDGDVLRERLGSVGFTRADRDLQVGRAAWIASLLASHGVVVICALVSPYRDARSSARKLARRFVEVWVDCPRAECARRDVKGLYAQAASGKLTGLTGVDDPYEEPEQCELRLRTAEEGVRKCVGRLYLALFDHGVLALD